MIHACDLHTMDSVGRLSHDAVVNESAVNAEPDAPGGFLCPCHGSRFDLAGRVVKSVPAPTNLDIQEYRFVSPTPVQKG